MSYDSEESLKVYKNVKQQLRRLSHIRNQKISDNSMQCTVVIISIASNRGTLHAISYLIKASLKFRSANILS